jgi:hypothetical protein
VNLSSAASVTRTLSDGSKTFPGTPVPFNCLRARLQAVLVRCQAGSTGKFVKDGFERDAAG